MQRSKNVGLSYHKAIQAGTTLECGSCCMTTWSSESNRHVS